MVDQEQSSLDFTTSMHQRASSHAELEDNSLVLSCVNHELSDKEQVKLLSLQLKDYRQRLFQEETLRQKMYLEIEKFEAQHNEVLDENKCLIRELKEKNLMVQELKRQLAEQNGLEVLSPTRLDHKEDLGESPSTDSSSQIILSDIHSKLSELLKHSTADELKHENQQLRSSIGDLQQKLRAAQKNVGSADQILAQKDVQIGNLREQVRDLQDQVKDLTQQIAAQTIQKHTSNGGLGALGTEISALPYIPEEDSFLFNNTDNWIGKLPSTKETVEDLSRVLDEYGKPGTDKGTLLQKQNDMLNKIMEMLNNKKDEHKIFDVEEKGYQSARSDPRTQGRISTYPSDDHSDCFSNLTMQRTGSLNKIQKQSSATSQQSKFAPGRVESPNHRPLIKGSLGLRTSLIGNVLLQHTSFPPRPPLNK